MSDIFEGTPLTEEEYKQLFESLPDESKSKVPGHEDFASCHLYHTLDTSFVFGNIMSETDRKEKEFKFLREVMFALCGDLKELPLHMSDDSILDKIVAFRLRLGK